MLTALSMQHFPAVSQSDVSPKALKSFEKAISSLNEGRWEQCEKELRKAIDQDPDFADPYIMLGDVSLETGDLEKAAGYYREALRLNPAKDYIVMNLLGNTLFALEQYPETCEIYSKLLSRGDAPEDLKNSIRPRYETALARKELMQNPVSFEPFNIGPANSSSDDYINAITADGNGIFLTRRERTDAYPGKDFKENFYYSERRENGWMEAGKLDYPPGTEDDAGAMCISPDGRMMFFTACFRKDGHGSCDLYYSMKIGDRWSPAINMGAQINSDLWDAQPSLSPDGRTLYFSSNRRGGYGSSDIWKTELNDDGAWTEPVNLGSRINTKQAEMAPLIHFDNASLYFSSDGHPGMGRADLFRATRQGSSWTEPVNLGYPINSSSDELIVVINPAGDKGFISQNSPDGQGGYDIFEFELYPSIRPVPVTYLKGRVFDQKTRKPLQAAFELADIGLDSLVIRAESDPVNGEFLVCLPGQRDYALNVSCPGYLFYSDHFTLTEIKTSLDPVVKDIFLVPVEVGSAVILRNIFFDTDQAELKPASITELESLRKFLSDNPRILIEISGHTDSEGTDEYNLELSARRAEAVRRYLTDKGIAPERMDYKGFGESRPIDTNDTPEGRANNRRTEIRVTGFIKPGN